MADLRLDRRAVLAALAAAPLAARAAAATDLDVAIVGGGVSGVYAAWRLAQAKPQLRIRLFEASARIGGRLHSVAFPQAPHLVAELGGMRFLEAHRHVSGLVRALGLPARLYPIDEPFDRVMLRGVNASRADVDAGRARFPYRVPDKDQTPTADFFTRAVEKSVPGASHMTAADWLKARPRYRGLADVGNRDVLLRGMTKEELALVEDGSGYSDWIDGETGLDEMDYFFVHDDESKPFSTIAGGYQQLPLTLAKQAGAAIATDATLMSLDPGAGGTTRLTVCDANGRRTSLTAARVILALPRRALECIADFPERARFANLVASVTPIPACKSLLLYKRPWWRDRGIVDGRSVTDLPARQFYALGAEPSRLPNEDTNGYGVLMAYSDTRFVPGWRALAKTGDAALMREVHREATRVLGPTGLRPLAVRFQDWSADPFGGGWHYYARGHDGLADSAAMLKPLPDRELYVCGEAYSLAQGWVEGALERAEAVLQRHFGLNAPQWVKA
ncbi:MAG TPA: NAD(P)/FAD-dependent oxidoreductase [Rhizomicrobium sp.]|jgi:monoamine oxidase|nr:NAD(P)/FAD-dependent oxidoreductase [Rhizomicrobium sp.]